MLHSPILSAWLWVMIVFSACVAARLSYLDGSIQGLRDACEDIGCPLPSHKKDAFLTLALLLVVAVLSGIVAFAPWIVGK